MTRGNQNTAVIKAAAKSVISLVEEEYEVHLGGGIQRW